MSQSEPQFHFGYVDTGKVCLLLPQLLRCLDRLTPVMITSIDSTTKPKGLHDICRKMKASPLLLSEFPVVHLKSLMLEPSGESWLTGFDEIWCLRDPRSAVNYNASTVGVAVCPADFTSQVPCDVLGAMDSLNCMLLAGDGDGLNYVTDRRDVAALITDNK